MRKMQQIENLGSRKKNIEMKGCMLLLGSLVFILLIFSGCRSLETGQTTLRGVLEVEIPLEDQKSAYLFLWEEGARLPVSGVFMDWEKGQRELEYFVAFDYEKGHFEQNKNYLVVGGILGQCGREEFVGVYGMETPGRSDMERELISLERGDSKTRVNIHLFPVEKLPPGFPLNNWEE